MKDVTQILSRLDSGDPTAADELLPLVYDELRRLAAAKLAHERPGQTLQATALVHEAYLRLLGGDNGVPWNGRAHFFGAAAEAIRRILVENARRKGRLKHGGACQRRDDDLIDLAAADPAVDIVALDEALSRFAAAHPDKAEVVQLKYFAGLNFDQIAAAKGISSRTVERYWRFSRAWLAREMESTPAAPIFPIFFVGRRGWTSHYWSEGR